MVLRLIRYNAPAAGNRRGEVSLRQRSDPVTGKPLLAGLSPSVTAFAALPGTCVIRHSPDGKDAMTRALGSMATLVLLGTATIPHELQVRALGG